MPFSMQALASAATDSDAPPDGDYRASMWQADIFESKAGAQFIRLHYRVLEGEHRDHEWTQIHPLDPDAGGLKFTTDALMACGVDVIALAENPNAGIYDLRRELDRVEGVELDVFVERKGRYTNSTPRPALETTMAARGTDSYGQPPAQRAMDVGSGAARPGNAIYGGDQPTRGPIADMPRRVMAEAEARVAEARSAVPSSDVPSDFDGPPQRGEIDPETGEPIPF